MTKSTDFTNFTLRQAPPTSAPRSNSSSMAPPVVPYASAESKPSPSHSPSPTSNTTTNTTPSTTFPALHLIPLNETFIPKQISLQPPGARVKIGRQTNAKTIPNGSNGYFDSKVLSRMHAEVWSEEGKVRFSEGSLSLCMFGAR